MTEIGTLEEENQKLKNLLNVAKLRTENEKLKAFIDALHKDNHYYGTRPCPICDPFSNMLGFDVGCKRFRKEKAK